LFKKLEKNDDEIKEDLKNFIKIKKNLNDGYFIYQIIFLKLMILMNF
jgi:hypothetical protein